MLKNMQKGTFIRLMTFCLLTSLIMGCSQPDTHDSENAPLYLQDYKDKWLVLNYWASWCKPCYTEVPELNRFYTENKHEVLVLGINYDLASKEQIQTFAKQQQVTYPLIMSDIGKKFGIEHITTLPATFIISPDGKITQQLYGPQTYEELAGFIGADRSL